MGFIKDSAHYFFSTREGLIVLVGMILTAIVSTIAASTIPTVGKFLLRSPKVARGIWLRAKARYKDWQYWKRFGPEYAIVRIGEIRLEKDKRGYRTSLSVTLGFKNRHDRRRMSLVPSVIIVGCDTKLEDGRKEPLRLRDGSGIHISLEPGAKDEVTYNLEEHSDAQPVLGNKVHCYWISLGDISFSDGTQLPLKLLKPFDVEAAKPTVQ